MEDEIKCGLDTNILKKTNISGGGCISSGHAYETDDGRVFVKTNNKKGSNIMFKGEFEGLKALRSSKFSVPKPLLYGENYIVMDFIEMSPLRRYSKELGIALATLHQMKSPIGNKFGFHTNTCCGFLPLNNEWHHDWVQFYATQRLEPLVQRIQREHSDRELEELWNILKIRIPIFFYNTTVVPSLLHGDLWIGNAAETLDGPISFDPASFYGHSEFDLALAKMFGGFPKSFFTSYHSVIPQEQGFRERQQLYLLFHNLNHWAHFGSGYRGGSIRVLRELAS